MLGSTLGAVYLLLDASPRGGIGIYHLQLTLCTGLRETLVGTLDWQSGKVLIPALLFLWANPFPSPGLRIPTYRWILIPLISSGPAQTEVLF